MIMGTLGNSTSESRLDGLVSGVVFERSNQFGLGLSNEDAMLKGFQLFQDVKDHGTFSYPQEKFDVVGMGAGSWTEEGGLEAAEDLLTGRGDKLNLILAENDFMGIGAIKELNNIGKKGRIPVAWAADGFHVALDMVESGDMMATGANTGVGDGIAAVDLIPRSSPKASTPIICRSDPISRPKRSRMKMSQTSPIRTGPTHSSSLRRLPSGRFLKCSPSDRPKTLTWFGGPGENGAC